MHSSTSSESVKNGRISFEMKFKISLENGMILTSSEGGSASSGAYKNFISYTYSLLGA